MNNKYNNNKYVNKDKKFYYLENELNLDFVE